MKKIKILLILSTMFLVSLNTSKIYAEEPNQTEKVFTEEQIRKWETEALNEANSQTPLGDFKLGYRDAHGEWSWRAGLICITDSYALSTLFNNGHAAIMGSGSYSYSTIEANPADGVQVKDGNWPVRFDKRTVYQYGVKKTTEEQDRQVAEWAAEQIGKKYNKNFFDINTRNRFYCSQLVWAGYKDVTGVDIGTIDWGHAIHPFELMKSKETALVYRNK